jgi:hypothetical protein
MFAITSELKGYFEYDAVGLYLRTHETAEIDGVVVDVENFLGCHFLCDGSCCLRLSGPSGPSKKQVWVGGDCCQGSWIPLSVEEQDRIAKHLEGVLLYMAPEAGDFVEAQLARGKEKKTTFCRTVRSREGKDLGVTAMRLRQKNCVFRVLEGAGEKWRIRCAIHSYCLAQGFGYLGGQASLLLALASVACSSLRWPVSLNGAYPRKLSVYPGAKSTGHSTLSELSVIQRTFALPGLCL